MTHLCVVAVHRLEAHLILQTEDKDDSIHPLGKLKQTHTQIYITNENKDLLEQTSTHKDLLKQSYTKTI